MSGTPFQTKFTIGLLTIEPCPQDETIDIDTEHAENDVTASLEEAAKAAIKAKKKAKKVARAKSRSSSPGKKPTRTKSRSQSPAAKQKTADKEALAKKQAEDEALAKKKAEQEAELARQKKAQEEEAARLAKLAEEQELAKKKKAAEEAEAARKAAEELASLEASLSTMGIEDPITMPTRHRPKRRISMFPASRDNTGLTEAIKRYGNNVPFDWEKPEWVKEHVNLKHTSTINKTYGWEKPDWARRSVLKKTMLGDVVKKGVSLERNPRRINPTSRTYLRRRHSLSGRSSFDATNKQFGWTQPEWARRNILKSTELGAAARQGINLEIPVRVIKTLAAGGSEQDLEFDASFASMDYSGKNIAWEKPSWAVNPSLKPTDAGMAVRQGADLRILMGDESARSRTRTYSGDDTTSPNASASTLNAWEKPSWANMALKRTPKGDKMKTTGTLARPITPKASG